MVLLHKRSSQNEATKLWFAYSSSPTTYLSLSTLWPISVKMSALYKASLSIASVVVGADLVILISSAWHKCSWTHQSNTRRRWLRLAISVISFSLGVVLLISITETKDVPSEPLVINPESERTGRPPGIRKFSSMADDMWMTRVRHWGATARPPSRSTAP
jgi:hypothetical protein